MKPRVVITGGAGRIASIIAQDLGGEWDFTLLDTATGMPGVQYLDVADPASYEQLRDTLAGKKAIIHLAWNARWENFRNGLVWPANKTAAEHVYQAAAETGVRVIMASSIHADDYCRPGRAAMMKPDQVPVPDSPYGATKLYLEGLGRYYAHKRGLEVVCIRFGGVDPDDVIRPEPDYRQIVLSRGDCASLMRCCLRAPAIPENFCLLYGISRNTGRFHDWSNPLGWTPLMDGTRM
jgi:uronate dehydrogenase